MEQPTDEDGGTMKQVLQEFETEFVRALRYASENGDTEAQLVLELMQAKNALEGAIHKTTLLCDTLIKAKAFIAECWDYHHYSAPEDCSHCTLLMDILDTLEATGDNTGKETDWERLHRSSLKQKKELSI